MLDIIIPLLILFAIILIPQIPKIGGEVRLALLLAALAAAIMGGLTPVEIGVALIDGVDQLAWVIMLSITGSIYAETQVKLGAMQTTMLSLRSIFGKSSLGLVAAVLIALTFAGSLLGDAIAASAVIGFLVIRSLADLNIKPEQIGMIILVGASLGSLMPPITQGVILSTSLIDIDPTPVIVTSIFTVTGGLLFAILDASRFVRGKRLPEHLLPNQSFFTIIKERWKTLVPLIVLAFIVVLDTGFDVNIFTVWEPMGQWVAYLETLPILNGIVFPIVLAIMIGAIVSFFYASVRKETGTVFKRGLKNISKTVQIQLAAGFMVGIFSATGVIDRVSELMEGLQATALKLGGTVSMLLVGMLTGSQTTAQTITVPFLAPALENLNVDPMNIALGAAHISAGGQNLPPVGLTAFVVAGLIGGILSKKVDPVKVMLLAVPASLYLTSVGVIAWLI
ncbi:TRAP transporter large permease subunit [Natribacillus halophilus]|uniref:Tripartite ATP-independent transporter, DctM component n=1 Tax=Natribacillus halophilus TaxID=549003 RepID=A0A1G8JXK6_9BACI|nr:TRAP transporter large permease subunit [Natribacillus halophilus]SDI35360.1 Tripartite ATP-independent transporter, DctM component [Natribacillus halophilus]